MKTIVILSGGLDSATLIWALKAEGHEVQCLAIDYGQRHACELMAAGMLANLAQVKIERLDLTSLRHLLAGSSQTDASIAVPHGHYAEESMRQTVVPNRNMILLSVAIGWACSLKYDAVAYAAHAGDHTVYPDCRPAFCSALDAAAQLCDWNPVRILRPFVDLHKSEIVSLGWTLGVPYGLTYSCYEGRAIHCGRCGACTERREAFSLAGLLDPIQYEASSQLSVH